MTAPTRTFQISLAPDLHADYETARRDESAHALIANRSDDKGTADAARTMHERAKARRTDLEKQIAAAARTITVTRLAPKTWGRLVAEHPPRTGDAYDARLGFNTDSFDGALMGAAITSVTDQHGEPTTDTWDELVAGMSAGSFDEIVSATIALHTARDAVPFSLPVSGTAPA